MNLSKTFRGLARLTRTFTFELGPIRATGVPAVLTAVSGIVLAAGAARALSAQAERLPETLREARALAEAMRPQPPKLTS